ncbi:MAG TPA: LysR family transcriptional regulator [Xanthobacteraceae bacterium]|nr:LysR family transcriptional regulator [Xanthobacteraceae bacterium]
MRGLNLDQLRAFAAVVEAKSFSGAAARLGVTQPAVSQKLRQLEQRFGVKLIERLGRNATPTAAGAALLGHARSIETALAAATDAMAPHARGAVGRVRLGSGATACIYLLPAALRELRRRFPALEIVVSTGNTPEMLRAVEENRIDLALITLPAAGRMLEVRPVLDDEFVLVAPRDMTLPREITAAELARLPLVQYEPGANTRRVVDEWALRAGVPLKPIMELGSVEAMKELTGAGLGCSVLPRMALRGRQKSFVIRSLEPPLYRTLALVLRRDKPLTKGLREVVRAVSALKSPRR